MIPESIGVEFSINVPLELTAGRDGVWIDVPHNAGSVAVKLPGSPGEVMTVFARLTDMCFQIGGPTVRATRASNPVFAGLQQTFGLPNNNNPCTHISFFGLDRPGEAIVNLYRRGS